MAHLPGLGCDFIAAHIRTGAVFLQEVKDGRLPPSRRKLTDSEAALRALFPGAFQVVLSVDEALAAVGLAA